MNKIKKYIEEVVDRTDAKLVDKISISTYGVLLILTLYFYLSTFRIFFSPILTVHPKMLYSVIFILSITVFYFTMLGEKTSKPINRPKIFLVMSIIVGINSYCLLAEIINNSFTSFLNNLVAITDVPQYLLITNIRIMSIYVPFFIVVFAFYQSFSIPFKKKTKQELLEYSVDILTKNINEVSERTINLKICEDIESGEDIILTEQSSKQHMVIAGSSGSGKTALELRPMLAQLFYKKAYFREKLKKLSFKAVEEGICYIKGPVTHKFINENFSMDYIGICKDKKEEFLDMFKDCIIGIRDSERYLYNDYMHEEGINVIFNIASEILNREIIITVLKNNMEYSEYKLVYENGELEGDNISEKEYNIDINISSKVIDDEEKEILEVKINNLISNEYSFKLKVVENSEGKIIYRDLGVTVVAPDGGLPANCLEIAQANGVKVHKIDPKLEEIEKGNIAKFNPLMVGTPEKAADVISSILVAMEQSSGKDANPYFTNASIRAIRNIVILLRVTYPKLRGKNPTLIDVLDILNDFNSVREYVEELQKDSRLELRWRSVIDYFVTSFYPQPKDSKGNLLFSTNEGVNRKKTADAISGVINQLDNLLGREELRYILCDAEEGLNLSDVLEKGECLAIATRQSELGNILGKAFALMFILSMQNAVLCRYSEDENPEIPNYLIIDEFPFYLNDDLKVFFTFSRKYKCSLIVAIQNIAQLCEESEVFKQIVFSNTDTKIILPGSNVEDRKYYSEMLGNEEVFETQTGVSQNPLFSEKSNYSETTRGAMNEKARVSTQELSDLQFKRCYYSYTNAKGKKKIGKGFIDFLKLTEDNTIATQYYHFEKYISEIPKSENFVKRNDIINKSNTLNLSSENIYNSITESDAVVDFNVENLELAINNDNNISEHNNINDDNKDIINLQENTLNIDISNLELDNSKEKVHDTIVNKAYNLLERQLMQEDEQIEEDNDNISIKTEEDIQLGIDKLNIDEIQAIGIANKNSNLDID